MRKIFSLIFVLALIVSSCTKDELANDKYIPANYKKFTASFEENDAATRTYIKEGKHLCWSKGDLISIFTANTYNNQYKFDGETGDNGGTFSVTGTPIFGDELNCHYAVYPYSPDTKISKEGIITTLLPAEQKYAENSFGLGDNVMVATTQNEDDTFLKFRNVCGYLKLQLYGDDVTIKSISLTGNSNETLAGEANITHTYGQMPSHSFGNTNTTKTITLDCGDGVKLGTTSETATAFWLAVPPTSFKYGFTISITNAKGEIITKKTSKSINIERNQIQPMAAIETNFISKSFINEFNPDRYIKYIANYENVYGTSPYAHFYNIRSHINCPISGKISRMELKFQMNAYPEQYKNVYLCSSNMDKDYYSYIYMNPNKGICYMDHDDEVCVYSWDKLNGLKITDRMIIDISFKDCYFKINNVELDYLMPSNPDFRISYFFTAYNREWDEGERESWSGIPEESKLYYIKIYDEHDKIIYFGYASSALNPNTGRIENCWHSYHNGTIYNEFAHYSETLYDYKPYGAGTTSSKPDRGIQDLDEETW